MGYGWVQEQLILIDAAQLELIHTADALKLSFVDCFLDASTRGQLALLLIPLLAYTRLDA